MIKEMNYIYKESSHFQRKCVTDYGYQKKILKDVDQVIWWTAKGRNVKGREGYKNIITEISVNSFDDISTFIFETFIKKYQPTIYKKF